MGVGHYCRESGTILLSEWDTESKSVTLRAGLCSQQFSNFGCSIFFFIAKQSVACKLFKINTQREFISSELCCEETGF